MPVSLALFDEPMAAAPSAPPEVRLWLSCVPPKVNHQRKKIIRIQPKGKPAFLKLGDRPELEAAIATLDSLLLPHQIETPVPGPIALALEYTWPWLASHPKRIRALGRIPHTSKPDADNVAKTLTDRLAALRFLSEDAKVADLHVTKWWGERPGIAVVIRTIR